MTLKPKSSRPATRRTDSKVEIQATLRGRVASGAGMDRFSRAKLREFCSALGIGSGTEISVVLCDTVIMRQINRRWRGKNKATDVLSFPQQKLSPGRKPKPGPLGDILISLPVARAQATDLGITFEDRVAHLLLHGLLHLLGYDHEREADARIMENLEDRMLSRK